MSYKHETQYDSPNFTTAADAPRVWGRSRTIDAIAIHWWGDPNTNPSYEGVIATLCNPNRGASAHFVVTGTGRRAAQLVNLSDASWATNSANPYTISIECDPRCRDEDYDVVAEVISQIWDAYGYKPLVPHRQFVATQCPGNYDLARLEALAKTKNGSGDWGTVTNNVPEPTPTPQPDNLYRLFIDGVQRAAYSIEQNAYNGYRQYGGGNIILNGKDVTAAILEKYAPKPEPTPEQPPVVPEVPTEPEVPTIPSEPSIPVEPEKPTITETIKALFKKLVELIKKYLESRK